MMAFRPRGRVRSMTGVLLLCSSAVTGCYRAVGLPSTPAPGTRVTVTLSAAGAEALAPTIGADAVEVEGYVTRWSDTEAQLELVRVEHRGPRSVVWHRESVSLPVSALRGVRQRSLDRRRTALAVGAVTGAAVLLAISFIRFVGGGEDKGPGPPNPPH